jgi:4-amino-4-deoxy-L-arabinose transferase-like glycosyltransferase
MRIPHNRHAITLALICLMLLGLALRLRAVGTTQRLLDTPARLIGDEPRYDNLAHALLQGEFFQEPTATPVYPLFLAACYLIFGRVYAVVLYVQALVGVAVIPLTYRLALRFTGRRSALLAAALIALSPALIGHTGYLYTEVLYTFLLLLTLLGLLWALEAASLRRFILAGLLLGISTLCRSATVFLPPLLPLIMPRVWSLRRRVALWVVYGGAMAAVIAPWTYHNYRTYDTFLPFSLSMTMLWHGSPEFYHLMQQKPNAIIQVWDEELNPERNGGINPITIEGDRYFNARAIASIRAEPGVYAWYSLQKLAYFWIGHPAADYDWPFSFDVLRTYFSAREIAGLFGGRLLLLLFALTGLIVLRRSLRPFVPLLTVCGYLMTTHAILIPIARYSEPLYPVLAAIIATAASETVRRYQAHRRQRSGQVAQAKLITAER